MREPGSPGPAGSSGGLRGWGGQCEVGLCKEGPAPDQSGFCSSLGPQWWRSWGGCPAPHALLPLSFDKGLPLLLDEFNGIQHKPPEGCWVPLAPWFCGESFRVAARGRPRPQWALESCGQAVSWGGIPLGWPQGRAP